MSEIYHILNGDALADQFPTSIPGEKIVLRECLVDGPVNGGSLEELFEARANYLSSENKSNYYQKVVPEVKKILAISDSSQVNFWFEDDLFCQVNFWFAANLLSSSEIEFSYVRPTSDIEVGFGGMNVVELEMAFQNRSKLLNHDLQIFSQLWASYCTGELDSSENVQLNGDFDFIIPAIKAHLDRKPDDSGFGRPERSLLKIMEDLNTKEFGTVFKEFSKREGIYGFGDLQVRRIYDRILNTSS